MSIDGSRLLHTFGITGVVIPRQIEIVGVGAVVELRAHVAHEGGEPDARRLRGDVFGVTRLHDGGCVAVIDAVLRPVCHLAEVQQEVGDDDR